MNDELIQILKDYVATANNPKYGGNWDVINSKFPELSGYDSQLLKDYVATANNSSYGGEWNTINSKFPEFFEGVKKKEPSVSTSQEAAMEQPMATGSSELPKSAGQLPDFTALRQQQQVETYGQVEPAAQVEDRLSPQAKAKIDERINLGEVQAAPAVKGEAMVDVGDKLAYLWDSGVNVLADLSQNIRQSVTGLDRTYVYEFVENNKERLPELYNEYTKLKGQGASDEDAAYGAYLQTVAIDPTIETRVNSFVRSRNKEKVREEVGSDLSKEQREKIASDLVPSAIGGLIESTPAMLSSASTYGLSFFDLAYKGAEDMLAQEFEQNPDLKLTPAQQEEYKLASGAVMAVLEKIGLSNTLKANPLVRRALTSRVLSSMAGLGKDASSEVFERVVRKELGTIARIGKNIGSGFIAEAETGALQELSQNGLNYYVNETSGKTVFDGKSATELVKDVLRAGIAEGIGGGFIAGAVNVFANPDAITEEDFDKAKKFASEVDIKKVQEHLADEMAAGKITKDEASQILNNINEFRAVANSVPENVSKEAQAKIFKLIKEKQDISKSVAGKDEAIQSVAKEQIKAIDDQIKELYVTSKTPTQDAVQEQATDEGVLRPEQPEVGLQEVVEGDQEPQVVAEEVVTQEEEIATAVEDVTFGTAFDLQNRTAERTVSDRDAWGKSGLIRERVENAGDILRELSSRGENPNVEYIQEKIDKLRSWIPYNSKVQAGAIPSDIKTIDDFNKTNLRFSNVTDGFEYLMKFNSDVVNKIRSQYEVIPTYTKEQRLAKDSVLALLNQDIKGLEKNLDSLQDVVNTIKREGKLEIVKEEVAPVRVEAPAGPAVEEQIADIERRRQEEIANIKINTSDFQIKKHRAVSPDVATESSQARASIKGALNGDYSKKRINEYEELVKKAQISNKAKILLLTEVEKIKIDIKYDAELAALEQANAAPSVEAGPAVEAAVDDDIQAQEVADLAAEMQAAAPTTVERLNRVAERARKAISKVIPDVKIIVHDTDAAYREASGDTEQGVYIPATKTIHINASKATPGAVAHEVFHAVFLDRVKTDVAAQRAAKKMVESLKRVVGEGSELYQYLDAFSQNYDANFQNEEKLAEFAAVLAESYMGLETSGLSKGAIASFKQAVKDFINAIAKRFGIKMPSTLTDADVMGILNAIAQKTVTGEIITEADVAAIDVLAEPETVVLDTEILPDTRQRKDSDEFKNWSRPAKSIAQRIGHAYNMNYNGFVSKTIDPAQFKRDVERIDKRLSIKETSTGSGYHMTLDGKFFNPYTRVIGGKDGGPNDMRQRVNSQTTNIFDIVETARAKGYTDKTIELYLKQEGFDAAEIKNALAVASGLNGAEVPEAFGYVEGGMAIGQSLFSEIQEKLNKMTEDGADKTDIRIEAQRLLMDSDIYKAQTQDVQAQLRLSLDASIGSNVAARAFRQEFKELRAMLASKKRMARELNAIKSKMRGFIRKNLPQGEYSKAEVVKLLKAIVDANVDSLPLVMQQVQNYVTEFKVRNLESRIKKLLATKTTKVDSGRVMGITTIGVQEDLATLNDMLIDDGMSEDNKQDLFSKQVNEYQTLNSKYDLTDEDIRRLQLLEIANAYNGAMLLDDNNPVKVESLTMARDRINIMITVGRSEFNANQKIKHQQQKKNVVDVLEAITGNPVPEDITDDDKLDGYVRNEKTTEANVNALKSRISKVLGAFAKNPLKAYFNRGASLNNLLGQITANLTDMFGGPVNEMVYDKLKQSDIELARRELVVGKMIESKLKEIYGEKYNIQVQQNKIPQIIDVFKKEHAVEARRLMEEMKTASPGRKSEIMLELAQMRVFDPLSQNKIYYLYNQFKSQENRAGLETNYGENYVEYLNELFENHLDPKVREWADWQVDVLFPELYDAYNPVYVEIFKTNMPWTANYAGRVYRKGDSQTDMAIPLMDKNGKFATIQTPSSTKARKQNKNGIQEMDGDLVLDSYIKDMEYFRAYGVNIRDISRIFKNEAVRIAVKKTAGEDVLDLIDGYIKIVGTNGMSVGTTTKQGILDSIDSNLGISYMAGALNQLIKQTTSAFLFAPRVGINNWIAYTAKAAPNLGTVWNEFIDNAPRIVKRYNPKEMSKIMGGYDSKVSRKIAEEAGVGNNRRALKALDATSQAMSVLMWPVTQGDKYSSMVGAMGNYLYYKDMYMEKNPGATNEQAIKFAADKVSTEIEQILGSSSRIDRDSYQNSGSTLFRALSFLSNSPKAMIRNVIPAYSGLFKKVASFDRTAGQGTLKQNLETVLMFQVFVPVLFKWAAIGLPGLWREWRDEDDEELGAAAILGPFEALLIVGPLLTLAKDRILDKPWADDMPTIPIYDLTEDLVRQVNKIIKAQTSDSISKKEADELREDALLNISYIIAGGFGIPAKNIDRMIRNIGEVIDGNEEPGEALLRLFNYSDYTIEGPDKKKK